MKNIKLNVLAGLLLASSAAFAGISGSPHDLSATTGMAGSTADNGEICVYCHTPHGASTTFSGAPLWNKADMNFTTFDTYAATVGGTAKATSVNNASLACLSCHDGVSSIDSIVNAPGSGYNTVAGDTNITGLAVIGNDMANIANLGTLTQSLANTHPISIVYTPGRASLRALDFNLTNAPGNLTPWMGATNIAQLLRGGDKIECGSCHDPHNGTALMDTAARAVEVNFLRHTNKASALCLGCHDK